MLIVLFVFGIEYFPYCDIVLTMSIEHPSDSSPEVGNVPKEITPEQLAGSVSRYLENAEDNSPLRKHQVAVFEDLEKFFEGDHRRGYIELPTGTGKTVLFVELAKALLNTPEGAPTPNILVVTPTQDLVRQTIGQAGTKGFGGFASELTVRPYYGESSMDDRQEFTSADVGITTYHSLDLLRFAHDFVPARELGAAAVYDVYQQRIEILERRALDRKSTSKVLEMKPVDRKIFEEKARSAALTGAQKFMREKYKGEFVGKPMLEKFDIVFLDEAHHALPGTAAWYLIERVLPRSKYIIGFTATPDASSERQLSRVLPEKIHSLSLGEAIDMGLLSPMIPVAIQSGVRIEGSNIYNESGEYIDDKISYLARNKKRNGIILDAAEVFANNNIGTIISCIAGGGARHALELAESLQERGINAAAVYSEISSQARAEIYQKFEAGKIDVLTFIGVLGEGWDSQRAKAIINARPTRSPIFATQRPGRVARPGGVAFTVDVHDEYETGNPPINVADILSANGAKYGEVFGEVSEEQRDRIATILTSLSAAVPTTEYLTSAYRSHHEMLQNAPKLRGGKLVHDGREYAMPRNISTAYSGVTVEILHRAAQINGITLNHLDAETNGLMRDVFDRRQASELLRALPMVDTNKYHIDQDGRKWLSSTGLTTLFSQRYPGVTLSDINIALQDVDKSVVWTPVRTITSRPGAQYVRYRALRMYEDSQETRRAIGTALKNIFEQQY